MHKVNTRRLLPRKIQMLPRYIMEAITERGKCYLSALFFLWRERERERERERDPGKRWSRVSQNLGDDKT